MPNPRRKRFWIEDVGAWNPQAHLEGRWVVHGPDRSYATGRWYARCRWRNVARTLVRAMNHRLYLQEQRQKL